MTPGLPDVPVPRRCKPEGALGRPRRSWRSNYTMLPRERPILPDFMPRRRSHSSEPGGC
jgi:hypothetical protein